MARTVDVGVVALLGLVLDVGDGDGDAPLPLLRRVIDAVKGAQLRLPLQGQRLGDGRRQARLAVVDVPDRPHVHMRLGPRKLLLPHRPLCSSRLVTQSRGVVNPLRASDIDRRKPPPARA